VCLERVELVPGQPMPHGQPMRRVGGVPALLDVDRNRRPPDPRGSARSRSAPPSAPE
jgi:hypothetical protein